MDVVQSGEASARPPIESRHTVLIVGGGAAGITVAAMLRRHRPAISVAIIEPSDTHSYQPGWTLVGGGVFTRQQTQRPEATLIPKGVTWIKQSASAFLPDENVVQLSDGRRIGYDILVACPGLQLDWNKIGGLSEAMGRNGVCSNYRADAAEYTWTCIKDFTGGTALFTQPPMPVKCPGAPQKIMYLAADHLRRKGRLDQSSVEFLLAGDVLFGVAYFVPPLQKAVTDYGIKVHYKHNLTAVDGPAKKAVFTATGSDGTTREVVRSFDLLHVTPPQSAPDFVKGSPLANAAGWIDVDQTTMRHPRYGNVFALGDVAGTPNSKTAAAVRMQAPVVVRNLLATLDKAEGKAAYDGYGACPLTVGYGKIVLAEFIYGGKPTPSFPLDPRVARYSAWLLKTKFLPYLYWSMMLKGSELDILHKERKFADAA
jgi:sulfide:quinone oxidoreductase